MTGAGGVLCGDMARAYAQAGAKVAALDLNEEAVKKLAEESAVKEDHTPLPRVSLPRDFSFSCSEQATSRHTRDTA